MDEFVYGGKYFLIHDKFVRLSFPHTSDRQSMDAQQKHFPKDPFGTGMTVSYFPPQIAQIYCVRMLLYHL